MYGKYITYHIKKYELTGKDYANLGKAPVSYVYKIYDYIYTGKNTDIITFDVNFNAAYYQTYTYNELLKNETIDSPLS